MTLREFALSKGPHKFIGAMNEAREQMSKQLAAKMNETLQSPNEEVERMPVSEK